MSERKSIKFSEYQSLASRTLWDKPEIPLTDNETMLVWNALGLIGEAGEVAELIKKSCFHRHAIDTQKLKKELGDVLWYLSAIATTLGLTLEEISTENIEKLKKRFPDGFSYNDSIYRKE